MLNFENQKIITDGRINFDIKYAFFVKQNPDQDLLKDALKAKKEYRDYWEKKLGEI